jgi:serine/threonine protein kinase/WD40 repeat protein/tetratricopeptide (TPR) repeat protein
MPSSDSARDVLLEQLAAEFVERHRRGEHPPLSEYTQRYPDFAGDIRELFPALVQIEQLKPAADPTNAFEPRAASSDSTRLERLGEYRIVREVGRGGMGVVYEAEQESLGRHVALKVLPPAALLNPTYLERFRREAKAAARLHHTNIVPVFGVGEHDGVPFYAMQFIHGEGLDKILAEVRRLRRQPGGAAPVTVASGGSIAHSLLTGQFAAPPPVGQASQPDPEPGLASQPDGESSQAGKPDLHAAASSTSGLSVSGSEADYCRGVARIAVQAAEALTYAHRQGILHRDIKPSNLLLDAQGTLWITDFGLAKAEGTDELTQAGDIVGTIRFMAPERFEGKSLPQSDVYSLGVTLYEMLTLQPAFDHTNKAKLIDKVVHEAPVPPRKLDPRIPCDLETVVLKCLAKDPKERYATGEALAEDLRRFLADRPIHARRSTTAERLWRWCRRNPVVAGLCSTLLVVLTVTAVGGVLMSFSLNRALLRTQAAERDHKRQVYQGHVTEAKYRRYTHRQGQRFDSLKAIRKALRLLPDLDLSQQEKEEQRQLLRDLAIACLTLPDVHTVKEWEGWPKGSHGRDLDDRGELYARSDSQGNVTVRRIADDHEVLRVPGDGKPASIYFTPENRMLVVWRSSNKVEGWRPGKSRPSFAFSVAETPATFRVARDGRTMATAVAHGPVTLYNLPDGTMRRRLAVVSDDPKIEFSPDGNYLAVTSGPYQNPLSLARIGQVPAERSVLHIYDVGSAQPLLKLRHPDVIAPSGLAWYPDSKTIAAAGVNVSNEIHIWDVPSGRKLAEITSQKGGGPFLSVNRTGDMLASLATWSSGGFRLWHAQTGQDLLTLPGYSDTFNLATRDGRLLKFASDGTKLRLKACVPGQIRRTLVRDLRAEKKKRYESPALHPNGRLLAVSMETGVGLWDLPSGRELAFLPIGDTAKAAFDSSGALWTYGHGGLLRWPVRVVRGSGEVYTVGPAQTVFGSPTFGVRMAVSLDGRVSAVALARADALIFHRDRPHRPIRLRHKQNDVRDIAVSADGRFVVTPSRAGQGAKVWEADTGKLLKHLLPTEAQWMASFTPDGKWLIVGSHWFQVGTWREGPGVDGWSINGGCISGDGKLLASYAGEEGIRLFDRASGRRLAQLSSPDQGHVYNLTFNRDGAELIGTDYDNLVIHAWDLRKLRAELTELGLDWDAPPYAANLAGEKLSREPPRVEVHLGDLEDTVALGSQPKPEHLRKLIGVNSLIVAFQPFNFKAYRQRGRAYALLNQARLACNDYSMALWLMPPSDPNRANLLGRRARNYLVLKEYDKALSDICQAERIDPARGRALRYNHARFLTRRAAALRNDCAAALLDLRKAVEIDPASEQAHNNLAWLLITGPRELRQVKDALLHARRAVALAEADSMYLNTLGVALYRNDQFAEAVRIFKKSLAAGKGQFDGFDLFFLAMCHAKLGDVGKAQNDFRRAVKWVDAQKGLSAEQAEELKTFRAEAEGLLRTARHQK